MLSFYFQMNGNNLNILWTFLIPENNDVPLLEVRPITKNAQYIIQPTCNKPNIREIMILCALPKLCYWETVFIHYLDLHAILN